MIDITQFFVSSAWAQGAPPAAAAAPGPMGPAPDWVSPQMLMLVVIFAIFYVFVIRPQQKKMDEQGKMIKALQRGDRVITTGGIHGKIIRIEGDEHVMLEIADGVNIKVVKGHIIGLVAKLEAAANDAKTDGKP
jgi:preprotein translocase subunit YajC